MPGTQLPPAVLPTALRSASRRACCWLCLNFGLAAAALLAGLSASPLVAQEPPGAPFSAAPADGLKVPAGGASGSGAEPASSGGAAKAAEPRAGSAAESPSEPRGADPRQPASVFYVKDAATGKLVPLLGFDLADFDRMLAREEQLQPAPVRPAVLLEKLHVHGRVQGGGKVEWNVQLDASASAVGWHRIPVKLPEAVFLKGEYEGAGEAVYESTDEGLVAWVRGDAGAKHVLKLRFLSRVDVLETEQRVRLTLPRAAIAKLVLLAPPGKFQARVNRPSLVESIRSVGAEGVEISVQGLESTLELAWWSLDRPATPVAGVAEAISQVAARVEGPSVRFDASLTIRTLQGKVQTLRIRLPEKATLAGAVLVRLPGGDFTSSLPVASLEADDSIEIRLEEPSAGPIECRLAALRLPRDEQAGEPVQFSGFELLGAARQVGYYAVSLGNDWQVLWEQRRGMSQIEPAELPDPLRGQSAQIAFETYSPRSLLSGKIVRRQAHVSVEPSYRFEVHSDRMELQAHWKYLVRRAGVGHLEIDVPAGWVVDVSSIATKPPGLVDFDGLFEGATRPLIVPLKDRRLGEFELALRAVSTDVKPGAPIEISFPAPAVNSLAPAAVEIQSADDLLLTPRQEKIVGVAALAAPASAAFSGSSTWEQPPLYYRTPVSTAKWAADWKPLPRTVHVQVETTVQGDSAAADVEQRFLYEVRHQPLKEIAIQAPGALLAGGPWEATLDGQPVAWNQLLARSDPEAAISLIRLPLSREKTGDFELRLRYRLGFQGAYAGKEAEAAVPLAMPADGVLRRNQVHVALDAAWKGIPLEKDWKVQRESVVDQSLGLERWTAVAEGRQSRLTLKLHRREATAPLRVRRGWIQTWLVEGRRLDRVCLATAGEDEPLSLTLPSGTDPQSVQVWIGGEMLPQRVEVQGKRPKLVIPRPAPRDGQGCVEVVYRGLVERNHDSSFLGAMGAWKTIDLEPPEISAGFGAEPLFWETVLDQDWQLGEFSGPYASENRWTWRTLGWVRQPYWSCRQLEAWVGAPPRAPVVAGTHRALFSTWSGAAKLRLGLASRSWLILSASSLALFVGLAVAAVPFLRRIEALAAAGIVLAALGWNAPDQGLLLAQAALLGGGLAAFGLALRGWYRRTSRRDRYPAVGVLPRPAVASRLPADPVRESGSTATASISAKRYAALHGADE